MTRVFRWLFNLAAAVSLAASTVALALWPWSYREYLFIGWAYHAAGMQPKSLWGVEVGANITCGVCYLLWIAGEREREAFSKTDGWKFSHSASPRPLMPTGPQAPWHQRLGFSGSRISSFAAGYFSFPCWLIAVLGLLLPTAGALAVVRRRRRSGKTCPACGYDLRGSPGTPFRGCPECGATRPSSGAG